MDAPTSADMPDLDWPADPPDHAPRTFTLLSTLPIELRENVYEHYLAIEYKFRNGAYFANKRDDYHDWPTLRINRDTYSSSSITPALAKFLPRLALTNKSVRSEVVRVLLRCVKNVILEDIEAVEYFTGFVEAYGGFNLLHALEIQDFGVFTAAASFSLITKCTSLHTLHLKVHVASVCIRDRYRELSRNKAPESIVADLGLDTVSQCKVLRRVRLAGYNSKPYKTLRFNGWAGLRKAGVWMKERFAEEAQRVVVIMSTPRDEEDMEDDWYDMPSMRMWKRFSRSLFNRIRRQRSDLGVSTHDSECFQCAALWVTSTSRDSRGLRPRQTRSLNGSLYE
jgi:hypothetical protein